MATDARALYLLPSLSPGWSMTMPSTPTAGPPPSDDQITPLVAAFIGRNWDSHYRRAWERLGSPAGLRGGMSWNWAGALFSVVWLAYRRRFELAVPPLVILLVVSIIPVANLIVWFTVFWFAFFTVLGLRADRVLLQRAWQTADRALRDFGPGERAREVAAAAGGVSTMGVVSSLIVMIPTYGLIVLSLFIGPTDRNGKAKGYKTQAISDLASLKTIEEEYLADNGRYTADDLRFLTVRGDTARFTSTQNVSAPTITVVSDSAYTATVTHRLLPGMICAIGVGVRNPVNPSAPEGEIVCK